LLYTCATHLSDPGFATKIVDEPLQSPTAAPAVSQEAIDQIKKEWEEKQRKRKEKEKEKEKEKKQDDEEGKAKKDKESNEGTTKKAKTPPGGLSPPASGMSTPATPSHEKYVLHRDVFALRQAEHRRRRQTNQAKDLAPRLPAAPRTNIQ